MLHVNTASYHAIGPTMRIARFVAETLGIPLIHNQHSSNEYFGCYDVLFVKHGMLKFSEQRVDALELWNRAKVVVDLENDYTFKPDARFKTEGKEHVRFTTIQRPNALDEHYVNWNVLTWNNPKDWRKPFQWVEPTMEGLLYYGAFRPGRVGDFKKYLQGHRYPVTISSYRPKKFKEACPQAQLLNAFRDTWQVAQWPLTIYLEDEASHTLYCSPANRFYECLQLGIAQAIDEAAVPTLEKAGFKGVRSYAVGCTRDVKIMLHNYAQVRHSQRAMWHRNFTTELRSQLRAACRRVFGAQYQFNN